VLNNISIIKDLLNRCLTIKNNYNFVKLYVCNSISSIYREKIIDFVIFVNNIDIVSVLCCRDKIDRELRIRLISKKLLISK